MSVVGTALQSTMRTSRLSVMIAILRQQCTIKMVFPPDHILYVPTLCGVALCVRGTRRLTPTRGRFSMATPRVMSKQFWAPRVPDEAMVNRFGVARHWR